MGEVEGEVRTNYDMKTDSKILLGRLLQKMIDKGYSQVEGYNKFTYLDH